MSRIAGEIKFYDADKGFGYIAVEGSQDYRVSINPQNTEIRPRDLKKGCRVTFIPKKKMEEMLQSNADWKDELMMTAGVGCNWQSTPNGKMSGSLVYFTEIIICGM